MKDYNFLATNQLENLNNAELRIIQGGSFCEDFRAGVNRLYNMLLEYIGADGL